MYKTITFLLTISLLAFSTIATAIPAKPGKIEYKLPDGTSIEITLKGDEKISWAETKDGYSLLLNKEGFYEYATLNENGDMVRSGIRAYNSNERTQEQMSFVSKLNKKVHFSRSQVNLMHQIWDIHEKEGTKAFPTTGNRKLICVLMGFQDQAFTKNQADFNDLYNQVGYSIDGATGSVKDYYLENSYGQFNLTVDVAGPYTASENMYYYGGEGGTDNPRPLVSEAIDFADPDVDFSDYDNDGDGAVDGVYIIYAGYGKEAGGPVGSIWAHAWQLASPVYKDGVSLQRYSCSAELRGNSGSNLTRIGVICHEFGHVLGAPDYYDTDYETGGQYQGTGQWDMMAGGSWNNGGATPAHHNGFTKVVYYNWATATELTSPTTIVLNNAAENSNSFYKISTATPNEYFLIENREKHLFDAAIPGSGMVIYHVHSGVLSAGSSNSINDTDPQKMYPVAQNAAGDPTSTSASYGTINTASCAWTGTGKTEFSDASLPSSKSWAAANTNKPITNIVRNATDKTVTFDFMGGGSNPSNFIASAVSSTQIDLSWDASAFEGAIIAFSTDGTFGTPVDGTTYSAGNSISGGGTVLYNGTASSFNHTGLQSSTTYHYKIWAMEDASPTYTSGVSTIESTFCDVITSFPYTNDFAGNTMPFCWENIDNDGSGQVWEFNNPGGRTFASTTTGNGFAILDSDNYGDGNSQDADMVSPTFNFTNYTSITLSFEHYFRSYSGSSTALSYSVDGGSTWTSINSWTASEGAETSPAVFSQDLTTELEGESNVKFKWNYTGSWGYYWCVDDIEVDAALNGTPYTVTFAVTDAGDSHPIDGASVSINSTTLTTDINGEATIDLLDGSYPYTVSKTGYDNGTGTVMVSGGVVTENVSLSKSMYTLTFVVEDENSQAVENASISVNSTTLNTDATGEATIDLVNGIYGYTVSKTGFVDETGSVSITGFALTKPVTLTVPKYTVTFTVTDAGDSHALDGASISINSETLITDLNGQTTIDLADDTYAYTVTRAGYDEASGSVNVSGGVVSEDVSMTETTYTLTFVVEDENSQAVENASISVNSTTLNTDATGEATIDLVNGNYGYTVSKTGFVDETGSVSITGFALTKPVTLTVPKYTVTFTVTDAGDSHALDGASISINGTTIFTSTGGIATIDIKNGTYPYAITKLGYEDATGSVIVTDAAVPVDVAMIAYPDVTFDYDATGVICNGGTDGAIEINNVAGGSESGYQYSIDNGTTWQVSSIFNSLAADTYSVVVKDDVANVSDMQSVAVSEPDALMNGTIDITNVSVFGGTDGAITFANPSGGTPPYNYSIDDGTTWQSANSFTNLTAGNYDAVVTDANSCLSQSEATEVTQPAETYTVTFTVYENSHVVEGATININSETLVTNLDGMASIDLVNGTYNYTANFSDFTEIQGEVVVNSTAVDETISFVGVGEISASQINIYPNPSNGIINIEFDGNYTVTLINTIGKVIQTQEMKSNGALDTRDASNGLYLLRIEKDGNVLTKPIIIKK